MEQQEGRAVQTKHGGPRTGPRNQGENIGGTSTVSTVNTTSKVPG